ncbi:MULTISPECIES: penicillin-binding protein activator [unclassified Yoonia]|uniref:penicillin-binding protein activator n=1 Tax=unclassified Yoonia TaxID=2629118 RepID=UPI002AFDE857|nr:MULTISPECIES: penicillin-binding protein activator [unclassified Yoonia]
MFARFRQACKPVTRLFAFLSLSLVAACAAPIATAPGGEAVIDTSAPVQVALLVPGGSGEGSDDFLARNFENAARMAIADLNGPEITLRVYNTGADPVMAASVARRAVDEGAQIILGPLFAEAANAVGVAVAGDNINVLAFSNNTSIAGGNVFILGQTFDNTARRLVQYASAQDVNRYMIAHGQDIGGEMGRDAIAAAVRQNGSQLVATEGYPLSQAGIFASTQRLVGTAQSSGAQAIFTTAGANADLPIVATGLADAGLNTEDTRLIGLTRWDSVPQLLSLPGVQGGLFALPDQGTSTQFQSRYAAAYGSQPHPLAGLAYDGIAAIGALIETGGDNVALSRAALTTRQGFRGTAGVFRLLPNGQNERGLAVATIQQNQVVILEQAPRSFGAAGL